MKHINPLIVLCILKFNPVNAQNADLGTWNILNIKYNHSDKLTLFYENQLRSLSFYTEFHYYELKGGVDFKINKSVKLTLAAGTYQTYKEGGNFKLPKNNDEFRLWPQVTLSHEIDKIKIEQRYRAEMRWTSNGYRNRFRYRLGIVYPFGKDTKGYLPFQAGISNELFFTDREPYFERNRAQFTLSYKASKVVTMQMGYLHQFDYKINDETGTDFLVLGFYYELFRKHSSKPAQQNDLLGY